MSILENAYSLAEPTTSPLVHIIRHGQSLHNIDRGYPHRHPPLTDAGHEATKQIKISAVADLIVISPMTRTIQTAMNAFPSIGSAPNGTEVQIWPDLREAHDAICNKGMSRVDISAKPTATRSAAAKPVLAVLKLGEVPRFVVSLIIKGSVSKLIVAEATKELSV
ncbi:hypothetical protein NHQ30_000999 [Ciborinia camelliae]|nr:hypothetical protein NHQ30_000999 [Ciborinia camelliae]